MSLRCLGFDPGLWRAGYALVREEGSRLVAERFGCIETSPEEPLSSRLVRLADAAESIVRDAAPDCAAVEKLFFGQNAPTAEMVWQARGVLLLVVARSGVPIFEPKPAEVKLAVTGSGGAPKPQVQGMVQRLLGLAEPPRPDDAADALAVAITGIANFRASFRR